jgi:membrane-associated phospholipid phosphatase
VFGVHPFVGGWRGFGGPNQSFPSGDVCLAAATSGALMILFPRWRIMWAFIVLVVMAERVAENAHYPSDTVAAVGLGWLLAQLAWRLTGRPLAPKMPHENASAGGV